MRIITHSLFTISLAELSVVLHAQPAIQWEVFPAAGKAYSIEQTSDGGYVAVGVDPLDMNDFDVWVIKLDAAGNTQWQNTYGGTEWEYGFAVKQTADGGYVITGSTMSNDGDVSGFHGWEDVWVFKLDPSGTLDWQRCLGGTGRDIGRDIELTSDGGYIMSGETMSDDGDVSGNHGWWDYWVVKMDALGNTQWQKCLGGSMTDEGSHVHATHDGGYIVVGQSVSSDGDVTVNQGLWDVWVVKLDASGSIQWQRSYGGTNDDWGTEILQVPEDGYLIAGKTTSLDGDVSGHHGPWPFTDYWVLKLDLSGNLLWEHCFGGTDYDHLNGMRGTSDGGCVMTGATFSNDGDVTGFHGWSDAWIVRVGGNGDLLWELCLGSTEHEVGDMTAPTTDGGYIFSGYWDLTSSWFIKFGPDDVGMAEEVAQYFTLVQDPSNDLVYITSQESMYNAQLFLTDGLGRELRRDRILNTTQTLDVSSLSSGIYTLTLRGTQGASSQRFVLE